MAIKMLNDKEVKEFIKEDGVRVVNVFATWCGPCQMFGPILEDLSETYPVAKVNIDESKAFAEEMGVKGIPATFLYKDGKLQTTFNGFIPKPELLKKIETI